MQLNRPSAAAVYWFGSQPLETSLHRIGMGFRHTITAVIRPSLLLPVPQAPVTGRGRLPAERWAAIADFVTAAVAAAAPVCAYEPTGSWLSRRRMWTGS